ncbi:DUF3325 domain-containing protein [Comamonas sp.]|uniref:DUF3325 domain-containing protein n=1 Tax=Comamonas sp. TaxID=34028 RepID=UPI002896504B|nr:DUF3325 domain-containing protein [Comamonas sp.]
MTSWQASGYALALAFSGMTALAFAMDRHHAQLTGEQEIARGRSRLLRLLGSLLLAAAVLPSVGGWGATVGVVAWLGWISAGALVAVLWIAAAPRWAARAAAALAPLALLGLWWWA